MASAPSAASVSASGVRFRGVVGLAADERLRGNNAVGVTPSTRRNVLVKCAASEKPALHAADVTVVPASNSTHARCSRSLKIYWRRGTPAASVKRCMNRDVERPERSASVFKETSCSPSSLSGIKRSMRLIRGWTLPGSRLGVNSVDAQTAEKFLSAQCCASIAQAFP